MKLGKIFILLISCNCLFAMEETNPIIKSSAVLSSFPGRRLTWTAQLDNGQTVNASSCYKRNPRNVCVQDRFKVCYIGRIGKKRMNEGEAKRWVEALIKASIATKKG